MSKKRLSQAKLKYLMHYNPLTGVFIWKTREVITKHEKTWNTKNAGKPVGCVTVNGYLQTCLNGVKYYLHRIAFLYMEGAFPPDLVDHRNRVKQDNRWENLRHADDFLNSNNRKPYPKNRKSRT